MKRAAILLALFGWLAAASSARADTGTYEILDYRVTLTPHADGQVEIAYHQAWRVTGGTIPWVTVGVPNGYGTVVAEKRGGAARRVRVESDGGWYGVHVDLDRAYGVDETFEIDFAISQKGLLYADANDYRLDFTPGWYDRARTRRVTIEVFFFAKADTISARPEPTRREGQRLFWEKRNLGYGDRFTISVAFPKPLFPPGVSVGARPAATTDSVWDAPCCISLLVGGVVVVLIIYSVWRGVRSGRRYGRGGGIFYGGRHGRHGGHGGGGGELGGIFSGGGGGFGGRAASCVCACACVGCACACACAGGSAAGCDRKLRHTCPLCKQCPATDCALHPGAAP